MEYIAPDGYTLTSSNSGPVSYTCSVVDYADGIYESYETTSDTTEVGIKQIKIVRTVSNNVMEVVVTESTNQELIDYKNSFIQ